MEGVFQLTGFRNRKRVNPFVQIDKNMLSDASISWKAKGILAYLLSKPDNWVTYAKDIENQSTDGRESVASGINELIAAGYMERKRVREKGQFKGYEYSVYEYPEAIETTENGFPENGKTENGETGNEKTENGKPATNNNELSNNDFSNNDLININNNDAPDTAKQESPFSFFEQSGFGAITPHVGEKVSAWIEDLGDDLVLFAMKIAIENGVAKWNYVESILRDWQNKNIRSIEHVIAHETKRKMEQSIKNNRQRRKPVKEELVPDWLNASQAAAEQSATSETESEDVERQREELRAKLQRMSEEGR